MYRTHRIIIAQHGIFGLSGHQSPSKGQRLQTMGLRRLLALCRIIMQILPPKFYPPSEHNAYNDKHNSICSNSLASTNAEQEAVQLRPRARDQHSWCSNPQYFGTYISKKLRI